MGLEQLNLIKKQKGMTNQQLADITGITISTIDKITSGNNTNPKLRTIEALCNALGCTLNDIMDIKCIDTKKDIVTADNSENDVRKQKLLNNYEKMNDTGKDKLVKYSEFMLEDPDYLKESDKTVSLNA